MNNILQHPRLVISDPAFYPDKQYIVSKIEEVLGYSSGKTLFVEIKSHEENVITAEELVDRYYAQPENYFELNSEVQEEYPQNGKIASESQNNVQKSVESLQLDEQQSKNIFLLSERNNFLYSCYQNDCAFDTNEEKDYRSHVIQKHTGIPVLYPTKMELKKYGLKPQGKSWEI